MFKLFQRKPRKDEAERKQYIATHGGNLKTLSEHSAWADLLMVKEKFQENAGMTSINTEVADKVRFQAAVQYTTLENFFQEVSRRIEAGEKAREELAELAKQKARKVQPG